MAHTNMFWVVTLWSLCCCCHATIVNPRTGEVGSSAFLRPSYAPSPRTEAPTNPNPGHYQVTEPTDFDITTRPTIRVHYDPRILPANRNVNLYRPSANAIQQWQDAAIEDERFEEAARQRLYRNLQLQRQQQLVHQQRVHQQQRYLDQRRNDLDSYHRGYNKKGFRNYENRENWGRSKEQHYGINDPRLQVGYQQFMRFFGDFSSGKGFNLSLNGSDLGSGLAIRQGAYGIPLYAPTFHLDYSSFNVLNK